LHVNSSNIKLGFQHTEGLYLINVTDFEPILKGTCSGTATDLTMMSARGLASATRHQLSPVVRH